MNPNLPPNDEQVERLLREHLTREAASVSAEDMLARVKARSVQPEVPRPSSASLRSARRVLWGLVAAAAVLMAFLGGRLVGPAQASAEALVHDAQRAARHVGTGEVGQPDFVVLPAAAVVGARIKADRTAGGFRARQLEVADWRVAYFMLPAGTSLQRHARARMRS